VDNILTYLNDGQNIIIMIISCMVVCIIIVIVTVAFSGVSLKRIEELGEEVIVEKTTEYDIEKFLKFHNRYLLDYRDCENILREISQSRESNLIHAHIVKDFFTHNTRPLINHYGNILGSEIVIAGGRMESAIHQSDKYANNNAPTPLSDTNELRDAGSEVNKLVYLFDQANKT
jgi:hypothetical protein